MASTDGLAQRFLNMPLWLLVALTVVFSVAFSVLFTYATDWALHRALERSALIASILIPVLVATPVAHFGFGLMHSADAARREAQRLANTDLLTGVLNRRRFVEVARDELSRREDKPVSVLLLDLDDFKHINDRHGHDAGDAVLRLISRACLDALRPGDPFARWGGEEFIALLPGAGPDVAIGVALRVRDAIAAQRLDLGSEAIHITASIGVAVDAPAGSGNLDTLITRADRAMYEAKRGGKNAAKLDDGVAAAALGGEHLSST
jgi:diguanylate cyclase (GGDEF)-like protein